MSAYSRTVEVLQFVDGEPEEAEEEERYVSHGRGQGGGRHRQKVVGVALSGISQAANSTRTWPHPGGGEVQVYYTYKYGSVQLHVCV